MKLTSLEIAPRDPLVARDGRPFGPGIRMHSMDWFFPSVLAGSLRSLLGKELNLDFSPDVTSELRDVQVSGPFLTHAQGAKKEIYFVAPSDVLVDGLIAQALRPRKPVGGSCDLPSGLEPVTGRVPPAGGKSTAMRPAFFSAPLMERWLNDPDANSFDLSAGVLPALQKDVRIHVELDTNSGAAVDERLFQTVGLAFDEGIGLGAFAQASNRFTQPLENLDSLHPLGGERRLARWAATKWQPWNAPASVLHTVTAMPQRLRMVLATPALFKNGWCPEWLSDDRTGAPPGADVKLRLIGACIDRWLPISGWSLEPVGPRKKPGPKASKRLVPAGSVYFFEVLQGNPAEFVNKFWLRPISDVEQDRKDGFGLGLWGVWNAA